MLVRKIQMAMGWEMCVISAPTKMLMDMGKKGLLTQDVRILNMIVTTMILIFMRGLRKAVTGKTMIVML